ncbi:MAG: CoA ester lyase [Sphingobium sp.]
MALHHARSLLFLPASNARAVEKVRALPCDMVLLDLEDAVADDAKQVARDSLPAAFSAGFGQRLTAVRINASDTFWQAGDLAALASVKPDYVVLPKVEDGEDAAAIHAATRAPVIAMIESPRGVARAAEIAATPGVAGLFMGNNDLRRDLRIPMDAGRQGLTLAMQSVVLAARLAGKVVFDGVYNKLADAEGFAAECIEARSFGFDGKTLIHPNQIATANVIFGPSEEELAAAERLIAAATGGAERHDGAMIEAMHVEQARAMLARAAVLQR